MMPQQIDNKRIAVLIPCFNEESGVGAVISSLKLALPTSSIYVYDNGSTDNTARVASTAGAIVRNEPLRGKGNVVRRMFADIEADIYVLIDGDGEHTAEDTPAMMNLLQQEHLDMVSGVRVSGGQGVFRRGHKLGNIILTKLVSIFFKSTVRDLLSGHRVFSRRFVKTFPALSEGFEIETELTMHALEMHMKTAEYETQFHPRAQGSASKLRTFRDGFLILSTIAMLIKERRPLFFFGSIGLLLATTSVILALPVIWDFMETHIIVRIPTLLLSVGMMLLGFLSIASGLILDVVARGRIEMKYMSYLSHVALHEE